jgi:hypothetical protein
MSRLALVALVACSSTPREHVVVPPPPADAATDAAIDARIDAAVEAPMPRHAMMRCRAINGPNNRFPKCVEGDKVIELARPIDLAILRHGASTDQGTPVIVDGGTNRGITARWRATLLDAKQREMGDATFIRLDPDQIEVLAPMAGERIDNFARTVRFTPPENTPLVIPSPPPKPDPIVLRIVGGGNPTDRGTRIVVPGGSKLGITRVWRAELVDANGQPLANGVASFTRLDPNTIEVVVHLTPDQVTARAKAVRFTPP